MSNVVMLRVTSVVVFWDIVRKNRQTETDATENPNSATTVAVDNKPSYTDVIYVQLYAAY